MPPTSNPYVGPRPFSPDEKNKFFGREREARDLLSLVLSEHLVLFYAQSGAGKTSLINTRLVPGLEAKNFEVLPIARVSGELPPGIEVDNIFTTNLMLKMDVGEDDPLRFKELRLSKFLLNLDCVNQGCAEKSYIYRTPEERKTAAAEQTATAAKDGEGSYQILPRVLIIDQFEELFNTHPEAWEKRGDFFEQLAEAMRADPYLWVVLAMREDYIAGLDPYASILPGGLRVRYYMQRLGKSAAMEAVTKPVAGIRDFEPQCAEELVKNLSRISSGFRTGGVMHFVEGESVEPVQLQVVCYQLWEDLKDIPGDHITLQDLNRLARGQNLATFINQALADFYEERMQKVLWQSKEKVSERKLRDWFSYKLITEAGTRGFVFMGEHITGGIPNEIVLLLEGQLLRGESRAGGKWYELVHDRFIDPILQSNQHWRFAQQRKLMRIVAGVITFTFILLLVISNNFSARRAYAIAASATGHAANIAATGTEQADIIATQDYLATQAESAMEKARALGSEKLVQQAEANSTIDALKLAATEQAAQLQLYSYQSFVLIPATGGGEEDTPTSAIATPPPGNPEGTPTATLDSTPTITPTPTIEFAATIQAGTAMALQTQLYEIRATQTEVAKVVPARELIIGQTVIETKIWATQLGTGTRNIILVGGMHSGFAPATVDLAKGLIEYFKERVSQIPAQIKLHIIANANPDSPYEPGQLSGRLNSNGVDLNRNWDCEWLQNATWGNRTVSGGTEPFSELETKTLRDYFIRTQPVAVVFFEARVRGGQTSPGGCGLQSLFSETLGQIYGEAAGYKVAEFEAYTVNGDASNWLDSQGIPAITVLLPDYTDVDFANNLKAVQALLDIYK